MDSRDVAIPSREEMDDFLRSVYPENVFSGQENLGPPFVTLSYAQSLDGKIAGPGGQQILLSGIASMALTHRLRELHEYILVGIGTVLADDPQLTARSPTLVPLIRQPTPVVIDSRLRMPVNAKLLKNSNDPISPISKRPLIFHGPLAQQTTDTATLQRSAVCYEVALENGHIPLSTIVERLCERPHCRSIHRSLMVEGGASVITSFLDSGLVDLIIITIAPVFIGDGIGVFKPGVLLPGLEHVATKTFGNDVVMVCRPIRKRTV